MSFSYSTSIPATPNDPADDQPQMQTNFASISSLIAVDHVGFNIVGGGQHEQVTFNSNNVPAVPTSPPVLFTNNVSAVPQLFFYSGDAAHSSTQYVNSANGSTFVLGGIILKWGTATVTNTQTVSFPVAFPNACHQVILQPINNGAVTVANDYVYVQSAPTVSGFNATAVRRTTLVGNTVTFSYLAIGN